MSLLFAFDTTQETQSDHSIKSEQSLSRIVFYSAISSFTLILSWSTFMSSSFSPIGLLAATLLPSGFILLILSKLSGDKKTQFPSRKEIPSILADGFFYFVSIFSTLSALAIESPTRILILGMICPKIVEFILAFLGRLSHLPLFKHFIKSSVKTKSTFRFNSILGYFVLVVAFLHLCFDTTWSTFGSQNSAFFPFSAAIWMLVASFFSLLRSKSIRTITSKDLGRSYALYAASLFSAFIFSFLFAILFFILGLEVLEFDLLTLSDAYSWIMLSFTLLLPIVINLRSKIATKNRSNRLFFGVALSIAIIEAFVSWLPLSLGTLGSAFLSFFGMELLNFKSEILTSKLSKDTLASLPLYVVGDKETEGYLPRRRLKHILTHIIDDPDSRKIFYFLCINFAFMFIEGLFGFWNNSLGLISDAAHMLFDCVALAISLYASYMSRMKSNETFTFGYGRYEIVAGLVNGIFLVFIAFSVFVESIERVYDPPTINSDNIIVVSVLGLVVNLIGVVFFHESHSHSHKGRKSHGHSHSHHSHNSNLEGIFLHVLADALGSVGVIFSSVLIHFFGWHISDPICSIIISVMILASVQPLIRETVMILLQRVPEGTEGYVKETLQNILKIEGVLGYRNAHFWEQLPGSIVASIHLHIDNSTDEQWLLNRVSEVFLNELGIKSTTIQLEKDAFISQLDIQQRIYTSGLLGSDHFE